MQARIYVTLKKGVLDPQGMAILQAAHSLGYPSVEGLRQGKYFEVWLAHSSRTQAEKEIREMCEKLLANTVIEDFRFEIKE